MRMQHESVDGFERQIPELVDQIDLNLSHLFLGRLGLPVSLSERKIAVPDEPFEGGGTVFEELAACEVLTCLFRHFY
jgi:hypothetical protein